MLLGYGVVGLRGLGRRRGGTALGPRTEDVDEQDCHDGEAGPHGLLPTVDDGFLGGVDERVRPGSGCVGSFEGVADAALGGVGGCAGDAVELGVNGDAVAGRQDRSEQSDAECGAETPWSRRSARTRRLWPDDASVPS